MGLALDVGLRSARRWRCFGGDLVKGDCLLVFSSASTPIACTPLSAMTGVVRPPSFVSCQRASSAAAGRSASRSFLSRPLSKVAAAALLTLNDLGSGRTAPS